VLREQVLKEEGVSGQPPQAGRHSFVVVMHGIKVKQSTSVGTLHGINTGCECDRRHHLQR